MSMVAWIPSLPQCQCVPTGVAAHTHPWLRCHPQMPSRTTRPCSCLQVYRQSVSYYISAATMRRTGLGSISRCTDQRWTNKSVARILRLVAYARTCRIRLRPLHVIHSTENRKSTEVRFGRSHGPPKTHREHAAVNLSQRDIHSSVSP